VAARPPQNALSAGAAAFHKRPPTQVLSVKP
jgi:hypothetical protein